LTRRIASRTHDFAAAVRTGDYDRIVKIGQADLCDRSEVADFKVCQSPNRS
jgi:hypothetical protein